MKQHSLFPIRVIEETWDDTEVLNAELLRELLQAERMEASQKKSNAGGWHSRENIFERDVPCFQDLKKRIDKVCIAMANLYGARKDETYTQSVGAWAIITRDRGYNYHHTHPNSIFSGCYYVSIGELTENMPYNAQIEFIDPHIGGSMVWCPTINTSPRHSFPPKPGSVYAFPSWLPHFVHPFNGTGERVIIAFNCNIRLQRPDERMRELTTT